MTPQKPSSTPPPAPRGDQRRPQSRPQHSPRGPQRPQQRPQQGRRPDHRRPGGPRPAAAAQRGRRGRSGGGARQRHQRRPKLGGTTILKTRPLTTAPALPVRMDDVTRIIPIGGFDETGARNCMAIEYQRDIIIVDAGLMFPEADMPGVDYIIPDISLLRGREQDIRGLVITHAHLDHMGAVPHFLPRIGNPPIYGSVFTMKLIQRKQQDFMHTAKPLTNEVSAGDTFRVGAFEIETFHEQHSVPDALGLVIRTPNGVSILVTGDWKFDPKPVHDAPAALEHIGDIGRRGVTVMIGDSTGADKPGASIPEQTVMDTLDKIFRESQNGRIIASTTGSNVRRLQQLLALAVKHGRKVVVEGFSMRTSIEIAKELKYVDIPKDAIIMAEESNKLPPSRVLILCTGAQAEEQAALMRIVNKEHRSLRIEPGDAVIFSSSAIPGNERAIENLKDYLSRQGAEVYHSQLMDVHSSGHAKQDDLKAMLDLVKPEFFIPAYGDFYHRKMHGKLALGMGMPKDRVLYPDNGIVVEVRPHSAGVTKERYQIDYIMVDGLGVGDLSEVVLRDRQILASDGMVIAIIKMAHRTGELIGRPDIVSRGFVYMKEQRELIGETMDKIREIMQKTQVKNGDQGGAPNEMYIKAKLRDDLGQFLFQKTARRPMIIPLLIEV